MVSRAWTLGPPARVVLAWLAGDVVVTSSTRARGRATARAAAAASHLDTGLLLASGSGRDHRALCAPGAQPMQTAPLSSRKMPKIANDDFSSPGLERSYGEWWRAGMGYGREQGIGRAGAIGGCRASGWSIVVI